MEEFDARLLEIVQEATEAYPNDVSQATDVAVDQIQQLADYESFVDRLVREAVSSLVERFRHKKNVKTRRESGYYGRPGTVAISEGVGEVYQCVYDKYYIGGSLLGDLRGDQLECLADTEEEKARTHTFNKKLLRWLAAQGVEGELTVRDVFQTEQDRQRLDKEFQRLSRETSRSRRSTGNPSGRQPA